MKQTGVFIIFILLFSAAISGQTLKVLTPNGNESWPTGQVRVITWQAQGIAGTVRIILRRAENKVGDIASDIPAAQGSFSWTVGALAGGGSAAPASGYVVRVRTTDSLYSDDSNAGFRIYRQLTVQQQPPELQPEQGHAPANLQVGQNRPPDYTGISGLPDLAIQRVHYYYIDNTINFEVANVGLAPYSGDLDARLEVDGGGCHNQTQRIHIPALAPRDKLPIQKFACDFFPDPCCYPFRIVLEPLGADGRRDNNVFAETVYKYVGAGAFRLGIQAPIRLRFSHGSKPLTCGYYAYNGNNTISRDDIRNDYGSDGHSSAEMFLEVPVRNCSRNSSRANLLLRIEYRRNGSQLTTIFEGNLANDDFSIAGTQERMISRFIALPIQAGDFFVTIRNPHSVNDECQVAFKFAGEFFE